MHRLQCGARVRRLLFFVGLAFVAIPVGSALAATATIGQTGPPLTGVSFPPGGEGAAATIFGSGVVTRFQFQAQPQGCDKPGSFDFQVLRPLGGDQYRVVGHTGTQTDPCDGMLHSYPVNITVQVGDMLGFFVVKEWQGILVQNGPTFPFNLLVDQPQVGDTVELPPVTPGQVVDESATFVLSQKGNGKNAPNGNGPIANPSPQTPNGSPQGCRNGGGWKVGTEARC
jgi:hypothetical protein